MTLLTWRWLMVGGGVAVLLVGFGLMAIGSGSAGRIDTSRAMQGFWLGATGIFLMVTGGMLAKFGLAGPYPAFVEVR